QQPSAYPRIGERRPGRQSGRVIAGIRRRAPPTGARDRPGHARAGSGRLEGRPGARGAGAERVVSIAEPESRSDPGALRARQESAGVLMTETIKLGDIAIAVRRKDVKHVHLSVHPPNGRVTLVAPKGTRPEVARAYAASKLGWIRDQQARLRGQA